MGKEAEETRTEDDQEMKLDEQLGSPSRGRQKTWSRRMLWSGRGEMTARHGIVNLGREEFRLVKDNDGTIPLAILGFEYDIDL
jgi:hypothetical protein